MPDLIVWKDQEFDKLRREMDRIFDKAWGDLGLTGLSTSGTGIPDVDLTETRDRIEITAEIPGIDPKDIKIDINESDLTINIESKVKRVTGGKGLVKTQHSYQSFSRTIRLPSRIKVDDVKASYKGGVLNINMPKQKVKKYRVLKIGI
ncbi:Heat shock protein Hsp20 [uncultured Desulfobacterium sp.]|uniref:Heat shock protein Hsp20 n=1 Tax=uncultured Desulfobacterium sp. TaxID=201089 RepID=A0A445MYP2_9BACT|nr:Heat shock protein Hsp20 [uncultured Desulfobacterium sp.]